MFFKINIRITKVMHAENITLFALWRAPYVTLIIDGGGTIYANGTSINGTHYASWYNDTSESITVSISLTVNGDASGEDDWSGAYVQVNTNKSYASGRILSVEDYWGGSNTTKSKTVTVPAGSYLTLFNMCDSKTWITIKYN